MSTYTIPIRLDEAQTMTVQELTLDGVRIILRARYVLYTDRWYLSVYDSSDTLIVGGIPIVPGVDLLRPYKHLEIPQGQLFSHSKDREPPTFVTLDNTSRLMYRDE